jgi:hypothetical protein
MSEFNHSKLESEADLAFDGTPEEMQSNLRTTLALIDN